MTESASQQRHQRYLSRVFALNPMVEAPRLLQLRRRALGLEACDDRAAAHPQHQAQASEVAQRLIKQLQQEFWTLPLDQLQQQLGQIDVGSTPAFAAVVKRLRMVAESRAVFPQLVQEQLIDLPLFRAFKTAIVLPPGEAGYEKERFLQSIRDRKRLKTIQWAVRMIRDDYPELYALENDWFETLLGLKKPQPARGGQGRQSSGGGQRGFFDGFEPSWWWIFPGMMALRMFARLFSLGE